VGADCSGSVGTARLIDAAAESDVDLYIET
jgi:hypothetical protein